MHLINNFVNNTLPKAFELRCALPFKVGSFTFIIFLASIWLIRIYREHKHYPIDKNDKFTITFAIICLIGSIIASGVSITHYVNANNKYKTQISKIAKKYPYSIEINPKSDTKTIILEDQKPSKKQLNEIQNGKELETNDKQIIMSIDRDDGNWEMKTSVLNHYSLNKRNTKIITYKTGDKNLAK